jgi:hypothetical protein
MRPMLRLILGLCVLVGIVAGIALALPSHVTVARSVVINAPEQFVFPYLNNLHNFNNWSPWAERDPQLQASFSGPEQGKGAKVAWTSAQRSVGEGSMEIIESTPNRHIDLAVTFNGMEGTSYFDVAPSGSGSKVTWGFGYDSGTSPLKRWKGLLLDRFVGAEYRDGLAKLKERIETERRPTAPSVSATPPTTSTAVSEQPGAASPDAGPAGAPPAADPSQAAPQAAQSQTTTAPESPPPAATPPAPPPATTAPKKKKH